MLFGEEMARGETGKDEVENLVGKTKDGGS
jgi:hypothetical protein